VLKHGDCFAVVDSHGDIGATAADADGVFFCDTRYLSYMELLLNGMQPLLLGSSVRDDNLLLTVDLTNPDIYFEKHLSLPKDTVHITRTLFLWQAAACQRFRLQNHSDRPVEFTLSLAFDSDFADVFEVRGMRRPRRGETNARSDSRNSVLSYEGLDGRQRHTVIFFDPPPTRLGAKFASYFCKLAPGEGRSIFVEVECSEKTERRPISFLKALHAASKDRRTYSNHLAAVETSHDVFNEVLHRSAADLAMLRTETPEGAYPYAGIPWYSTTFGRDGIITAIQTLWRNPGLAKGVLKRLAAWQAKDFDAAADAQPGKILHEMRSGEMAGLHEVPFGLYYGSVDSTPLFVLLAGLYADRTEDWETLRELWPNIEAALHWIDQSGDLDGDGFVEYMRASDQGLINHGWKDSSDAVFHADGTLAAGPIALAEVQGYVYAAKHYAARCARRLGRNELAQQLERDADTLAKRFDEAFWYDEIGSYALALDGQKRPCLVRTSNAGQVLFSGIARPERAAALAKDMLQPDFFSGWGIRTVAQGEARYNPMSYHNGSVWPHDNAMIAAGFAHYGLKQAVNRVFEALFEAATYMELRRLPELFCGFRRKRSQGPTLYPVACLPQAWAAGAPFGLLQAAVGLEFQPARNEIVLRNPRLPRFLSHVTFRNLRIGPSSVDLALTQHGSDIAVQVLRKDGPVSVTLK
jgi:glycogen debranching enzyme